MERLRALRHHDSFWGEMSIVAEQTGSIQITQWRECRAWEFKLWPES